MKFEKNINSSEYVLKVSKVLVPDLSQQVILKLKKIFGNEFGEQSKYISF